MSLQRMHCGPIAVAHAGHRIGHGLLARAWVIGLMMLLLTTGFVVARTATIGDGDLSTFVLHGRILSAPSTAEPDDPAIRVLPGAGYDGQFYYRMALDPTDLTDDGHGIHLDTGARRQRIGYPILAYLFSAGRPQSIPVALVAVNVLAIAAAALLAGLLARSHGRSAAWGLLVAGYGGLAHALSRDLTEPVAFAFLLAALLALRKEQTGWAVVAMTAAALTRETALLLPGAILLVLGAERVRSRNWPKLRDLLWLVPVLVWAFWQAACRLIYGAFPVGEEAGTLVAPGSAAGTALARWLRSPDDQQLQLLLGVLTVGFLAAAALVLARRSAPPYLLVATAASSLLALSLSAAVWVDDAMQLRIFSDVHLYGSAALLTTRGRVAPWVGLLGTLTVLVLAVRLRLVEL